MAAYDWCAHAGAWQDAGAACEQQQQQQQQQQHAPAAPQPPAVLGKRARSGASRSAYRGVSHHARTDRHESHIWLYGKQLYLGGFYTEETAAAAYDLAAVRLRGTDAQTNFPLDWYAPELAAGDQVDLDSLVAFLRGQAKALARIETSAEAAAALCMHPWELEISEALSGGQQPSLGVYASEAEAARTVDRALLARDGLAAQPCLAFPLADYLHLLDVAQVREAQTLGLLPAKANRDATSILAAGTSPDLLLLPIPALAPINCKPTAAATQRRLEEQQAAAAAGLAPPLPVPVARKASITPRAAVQSAAKFDAVDDGLEDPLSFLN